MTERDYTASVETRNIGDLAREEIEDARAVGADPMAIAKTHQMLARLIPALLEHEATP